MYAAIAGAFPSFRRICRDAEECIEVADAGLACGRVQVGVVSSDAGTSGRFTWRVHNFPLFRDMIKAQKIMSPVFTAGECSLRLSVYQSSVGTVDYMSMWCALP